MSDDSASDYSIASEYSDEEFVAKPKAKVQKAQSAKQATGKVASAPKPKAPVKKAALKNDENLNTSRDDAAPSKGRKSNKGKTIEQIYQKKTQLEHILLRPDTYIGSVEAIQTPMWIFENEKFVLRNINYVPGLYKIFDEILVNAADNKIRDPSMNALKVTIDPEKNFISVYNNGRGIPIEIHKDEHMYVPELIFGHLLTSSNYNDSEKKVTGGRNGFGAKLCNIFSTEFTVETADSKSGKKFKQIFSNNMGKRTQPSITSNPRDEDYTRISFKPDLEKFNMTRLDEDIVALMQKRVYDMVGCCKDVKVWLNDQRLKVKDFKNYVQMYLDSADSSNEGGIKLPLVHEIVNDRWEVAVSLSEGQFQQVSFVNSICTSKGGTHVNYVTDQIVTKLIEAVKKKNKAAPIKPFQVKNHLWVFINCLVENPSFDSQTKENLTLRASAFGRKCDLSEEFMKKTLKTGVIENLLNFAKAKQDQLLRKTDGSKKTRVTGIAKLDDANNAGTKQSSKCTLILTEGDSAKALAVSGLAVVGRDNYGVFPLRGKLLNVREAAHSSIMSNQEIQNIKQILGLQHGKKYTSTESLRYGHLMIMTDQDHDGSHIKGLIINFLDHFYPSLLKVPGFLLEFITPIVKCTKGKNEVSFFTIPEYEAWKKANNEGKGWNIKYYKGLGTSTTQEAKNYFSALEKHKKPFRAATDSDRDLIDMAFNKKKADNRKEWLRQFEPGTYMDHSQSSISITDFINRELILFSMADNIRSIPSVVDGLKPGQRKILFACFKRNLKNEIKVAQLAGYVSEHSAYHHGEQSLCATIVNLAQDYVGSNNINLLEPRGQFGTRLQGGKDSASPRYIFTTLSPVTRKLFHNSDDHLLNYLNDDGQKIEPTWYMPIIPMILVNGSEGIGTGWSSSVPNYNPRDIIQNLKRLMRGEEPARMHPWYKGFDGTIELLSNDKYKLSGTVTKINDTTLEITELPVRTWTQSYKEFLEEMLTGTEKNPAFIKDYKEYHTDSTVHFIVSLTEENMMKAEVEGLEKKFKLSTTMTTSNMVCFDEEGRIKKYNAPEEILQDFYDLRLKYYQKRKTFLTDQLVQDYTKLENKVRFITAIIEGKLKVQNRKKVDIIADLKAKDYEPFSKKKSGMSETEQEEDDNAETSGGYDYLLSMQIWNLTWEKVEQLKQEVADKKAELDYVLSLSPKQMWEIDLDTLLVELDRLDEECDDKLAKLRAAAAKKGNYIKARGAVKTGASKKKAVKEEEDYMDFDEADDFVPKAKKPAVKKEKNKIAPTKEKGTTKDKPILSYFSQVSSGGVKESKTKTESNDVDLLDDILFDKKPQPKKKAVKVDSDLGSDDDDIDARLRRLLGGNTLQKTASPTSAITNSFSSIRLDNKKIGPSKSKISLISDEESDDSGDDFLAKFDKKAKNAPSTKAPQTKATAKPRAKKSPVVVISDDEKDDFAFTDVTSKGKQQKRLSPVKHKSVPPKRRKIESDEDDDSEQEDIQIQTSRPARNARTAATKSVAYIDVESGDDREDLDSEFDQFKVDMDDDSDFDE
ncbi:DNA topoisomerase [Paraphysoderma sedebokerense]|nr:DNA topoisomerase [Paraphysoderma sedebokerense]